MTRERGSSLPASQRSSQRPECEIGRATGVRCALPATAATGYRFCQRHDPDQLEQRRVQASQAARASHATVRLDPETESWADNVNWDDEAAIYTFLRETAVLVAKKALTPAQGQVMARLAEERLKGFQKVPPPPPTYNVVMTDFSQPPEEPPAP
jgi:hypothetical protein